MSRLTELFSRIAGFVTTDIWRIRRDKMSRPRSILIKQLRVLLLAMRGFREDECYLRASALTFYSLLSIVPVLALAFGIAKGFDYQDTFQAQLLDKIPAQQDVLIKMLAFARSMLDKTKGGVVAGIGVVLLFWAVIKVFGNIERSFNDIWGIKQSRSLIRKFTDYLSMMLICPILLVSSGSVTVAATSQFVKISQKISLLGAFAPIFNIALSLAPYIAVWAMFTFVYLFMPNTKVRIASAVMAGVVAGTMFQLIQGVYIYFQVGVAKYNAIYGSFAALPLFLLWLQISWFIMLFGAEISFAYQNADTFEFEMDCLHASHRVKRLLALRIVQFISKRFSNGEPPRTAFEISQVIETPVRLVREILFDLVAAGILVEVKNEQDRDAAYQPARPVELFTPAYVIKSLDMLGSNDVPVAETDDMRAISESLATFDSLISQSPANRPLKDV